MTSSERAETVINLSWDVVDACPGFGIDIGGSVMKCAYVHKDDWIPNVTDRKEKKCPVRLVNFAREEMELSFGYLKERMFIRRASADDKPLVYTTGIGGSQFMKRIQDEFNVRTENLTEMDLFVESHKYFLENLTLGEITYPHSQEALERVHASLKMLSSISKAMNDSEDTKTAMASNDPKDITLPMDTEPYDPESSLRGAKDLFPNMVSVCGSAGCCMTVFEDGSFHPAEMLMRVGRTFYGLGSLLTGARSYEELMSMAEKGTDRTIHQYTADLQEGIQKTDDSIYATWMSDDTDWPAFLFGKCVGKTPGDFKKEDLAHALAMTMATDLVQVASLRLATLPGNYKYVFFCGNYVNHPLMRTLVTREWLQRDLEHLTFMGADGDIPHVFFLRHGAHYGALGALLNHHLRFTDKMAEMALKSAEHIEELRERKRKQDMN